MVLLHDIPNLLWLSSDAVATFVVGQISCNWDNLTQVQVTLLFLLWVNLNTHFSKHPLLKVPEQSPEFKQLHSTGHLGTENPLCQSASDYSRYINKM